MVVINHFGEFVQGRKPIQSRYYRYSEGVFVKEFPDATDFKSLASAKFTVQNMKRSKQFIATYYVVENYGMENETRERIG